MNNRKRKFLIQYLTELTLGDFLNEIFVDGLWIHDKCFIDRRRPDYRNDKLKFIVEFNGYQHYTNSKVILNDYDKISL